MLKRCLFLALFMCHTSGWAQDTLFLSSLEKRINLDPYFSVFIDKNDSLDLQQILRLPDGSFTDMPAGGLRTDVTDDVIWLRLIIDNRLDAPAEAIIDFIDPSLGCIVLYELTPSGVKEQYSGTMTEPEKKSVTSNRNSFLIRPQKGYLTVFYFKVTSPNYMTISARLQDDEPALLQNMRERTFLGLFYGAVLIFMLYNFLLFAVTRLRVFVLYALYIFFIALLTGAGDGFTAFYLHFIVTWTHGYQDMISAAMGNILGLLFMREFLQVKTWSASFNRLITLFIGLTVLSITFAFLTHPGSGFSILNVLGLITLMFHLTAGVLGVKREAPQALYYLVAYTLFGVFILLYILNLYRLVSFTFLVQYSIHLGYILSILIFSFALGVRIYRLYQNYMAREQEKKNLIEQKNRELEVKVTERTRDISVKEANLRAILDNTDNAIWLIDKEYHLIDYNNVFENLCKAIYNTPLRRNQNVLEVTASRTERNRWKKRYDLVLAGEGGIMMEQNIIDGKTYYFEIHSFPIHNGDDITGASIFARDITIRVNALEQLKKQNKALQKVNKELDSFVYSASHDLKAPLASVIGLINLVRLEKDAEAKNSYYKMMEESIHRLDQFIGDIIDYSRNARVKKEAVPINFEEVVQEVVGDLKYMTDNRQIEMNINIRQEAPFKSDLTRVKVILRNLISNAIKYGCTRAGSERIDITCEVAAKKARLEIQDYGMGIAEEHRKKIFDMFYKANEKGSGTGLGLYIVKETVEKLNGRIRMTSQEGEGTTFIVELPQAT